MDGEKTSVTTRSEDYMKCFVRQHQMLFRAVTAHRFHQHLSDLGPWKCICKELLISASTHQLVHSTRMIQVGKEIHRDVNPELLRHLRHHPFQVVVIPIPEELQDSL
jgi:hypothetical protein